MPHSVCSETIDRSDGGGWRADSGDVITLDLPPRSSVSPRAKEKRKKKRGKMITHSLFLSFPFLSFPFLSLVFL
jgi:hypothetical protein